MPLAERLPCVKKIAVLRANSIGDLIFCLPALDALRAAYPEAEIMLLARAWHAEFLRGRPGPVDRVIVLPPISGISLPGGGPDHVAAPEEFLEAMRAERLDVAVQLHGGGKTSNPFLARLGARFTAGMRAPDAAPLDRWVRYVRYHNEILRCLEVAALLGAPAVRLEPHVAVTAHDRAESEGLALPPGPFVILHAGATDERRRWPVRHFARLGDRLADAGFHVVVSGDASEAPLVAECVATMRRPAHDAAGRLGLGAFAALLSRARLVVGNDTGPLHLARAVDAPSVTIYWAGNLLNAAPVTRHAHRALGSWQLACPVCGVVNVDERCAHQVSFLEGVTFETVEEAAFDVLACTPERDAARERRTGRSDAGEASAATAGERR